MAYITEQNQSRLRSSGSSSGTIIRIISTEDLSPRQALVLIYTLALLSSDISLSLLDRPVLSEDGV